jgi:hypothetical protein
LTAAYLDAGLELSAANKLPMNAHWMEPSIQESARASEMMDSVQAQTPAQALGFE